MDMELWGDEMERVIGEMYASKRLVGGHMGGVGMRWRWTWGYGESGDEMERDWVIMWRRNSCLRFKDTSVD